MAFSNSSFRFVRLVPWRTKRPLHAVALLAFLLVTPAAWLQTTKFGIRVQPGPMDEIRVKDYTPDSSLIVPATSIDKARFPVIDVHTHSNMNNIKTRADAEAWLRTMDAVNVEKSVVFTNAIGAEFDRQAELFQSIPGNRFQVWCSLDTKNIDQPDYSARAVAELERCYRKGARGVGEITDKGWGLEASERNARPRNKRLRIDDPRLDAFWDKCAELKIPVNIHLADHPSCWKPLGPRQERTPDFQHFNMTGKDVPSYEELLAAREPLLKRHRKTKFIFCHLSNQGNDTASLSKLLEAHPNLYLDLSARDYELGRQPRTAHRFLIRYQDRILFGTDMGSAPEMYRAWWRLLESGDEFLQGRLWWRLYGLELPNSTLKQIYRENARRLLNWN